MSREEEVKKEITRLQGATESQLVRYNDELSRKRTAWFEGRKAALDASTDQTSTDTLEAAYRLLLKKLSVTPEQMPIVQRVKNRIVFHSKNFCPTLEACIILGMDTRKVCKLYNEKATDALIKKADPSLRFARNYRKLRPYAPCCEEMIIREDSCADKLCIPEYWRE